MNRYLGRLTSMERRFLAGVLVVMFTVLNLLFVWPRFADWGDTEKRLDDAQKTLAMFNAEIQQKNNYDEKVKSLEGEGDVLPEDQATELLRAIQSQAAQSGVSILGTTRQTTGRTNQFFMEQAQSVTVQATEKQLVDFLFNLSSRSSMIRVRDLAVRPDPPRQQLSANIKLVASYQKKPMGRSAALPAPAPAAKSAPPATAAPAAKPAANPASPAVPAPIVKPVKPVTPARSTTPNKSATSTKLPPPSNPAAPTDK
jgi:Tfp pilus assembly protein PilO